MPPLMGGGPSQPFARAEHDKVPIDGGRLEIELLKRLEEQAEELAQLRSRTTLLESAVDGERKARQTLSVKLEAERATAKQLKDRVQQLKDRVRRLSEAADRVPVLESEIARERAGTNEAGRGRLLRRRT